VEKHVEDGKRVGDSSSSSSSEPAAPKNNSNNASAAAQNNNSGAAGGSKKSGKPAQNREGAIHRMLLDRVKEEILLELKMEKK
jgi:hypothetical protein